MKKHVLQLLVLSHAFWVPYLKTVCIDELERDFLAPDNVVDMLQLARLCDAPRLSLLCTRMVIGDFKNISLTEGWKVMRRTNPSLEQELLESLVDADTVSFLYSEFMSWMCLHSYDMQCCETSVGYLNYSCRKGGKEL
jgi:hypothetical protein